MVTVMSPTDVRFAEIYGSYFKHVHAYFRRRTTPDRVDDATAETFLIAWRKIGQVPDGEDALPWLYGVANGVISNLWRGASRQKRLSQRLNAMGVESVAPPEEFVVMRQEAHQILTALSSLKRADQEVLRLSIWEDLSSKDLAQSLNISVDAARQRLSRARKNLARQYDRLDAKQKISPIAQNGGAW
jgi:RNA polymerase sigma-70 factor (ECF subfamily)